MTGSTAKRVVAVVLNWCNEPDTATCLESLAASRYDALTVLLVDNGSPDSSGDRLHARFPGVAYLQTGTNFGYAGGNNRGFTWALEHGADYVLVLNDDTVIDPDCVPALVRAAEETGAAIVAPQIRYYDQPELIWYGGGRHSVGRGMGVHRYENARADVPQHRERITFACGCCFLFRAEVLRAVGGFDESFFAYVEDTELSLRLARRGYTIWYEPAATVLHRITRGAQETPFQIRQRDTNRRRMVRLHYGAVDRARFAFWYYPTRMIHLLNYVARRDWARARAILDGTFGRLDRAAE